MENKKETHNTEEECPEQELSGEELPELDEDGIEIIP